MCTTTYSRQDTSNNDSKMITYAKQDTSNNVIARYILLQARWLSQCKCISSGARVRDTEARGDEDVFPSSSLLGSTSRWRGAAA